MPVRHSHSLGQNKSKRVDGYYPYIEHRKQEKRATRYTSELVMHTSITPEIIHPTGETDWNNQKQNEKQ